MRPQLAQPSIEQPADRLIAALAAVQHGVVARRQLVQAGVTPGAIRHRLAAGRLHQIHRSVYAVGHTALGRHARWMAAVLACGDGAVVSHVSAAALWTFRPGGGPITDVTIPTRAGRAPRAGIRVHRSGRLTPDETAEAEGIPVTSPARTLLDLADVLPARAVQRAAEESVALRLFDLAAIEAVLVANPGRAGAGRLQAVLADMRRGSTWTRSELEERFLALCDAHGLPRPEVNAWIAGVEVDFLWREAGVVVETDGFRHHGTRAAFERDRARDARLAALGLRTLRFTYRQVVDEPATVAGAVREVLRQGGGRVEVP